MWEVPFCKSEVWERGDHSSATSALRFGLMLILTVPPCRVTVRVFKEFQDFINSEKASISKCTISLDT